MGALARVFTFFVISVVATAATFVAALLVHKAHAEPMEDYTVGWALLEVSALASDPNVIEFATESGCQLAEDVLNEEPGMNAFCAPVLIRFGCMEETLK